MIQYESANLDQIQADLACEPEQEGAAFCEYLEFTDIYRYLQRVFAREGITSQLLLLTLTDEREQTRSHLRNWKEHVPPQNMPFENIHPFGSLHPLRQQSVSGTAKQPGTARWKESTKRHSEIL